MIKYCKSKKNEAQVVAACSDTDATIGIYLVAYVGSNKVIDLPDHLVFPEKDKYKNPSYLI